MNDVYFLNLVFFITYIIKCGLLITILIISEGPRAFTSVAQFKNYLTFYKDIDIIANYSQCLVS